MESLPPVRSDPEFRPLASERSLRPYGEPGDYRRILVNPFLGLLGLVVWLAVLRTVLSTSESLKQTFLASFGLLAALVVLLPRLFHYHCLDCGRTGRLTLWKSHVCPAVAHRIMEGQPRRFRGPGPLAQTLLWAYLLIVLVLLAHLGGFTSR